MIDDLSIADGLVFDDNELDGLDLSVELSLNNLCQDYFDATLKLREGSFEFIKGNDSLFDYFSPQ